MRLLPIYALALFIILCSSCGKDDATPEASALAFFPLQVGTSWVYETLIDDDNGPQSIGLDTISVLTSTRDGEDIVFTLSPASNFLLRSTFPTTLRLREGKLYQQTLTDTILFLTIDPDDIGEVVKTTILPADLGVIEYRYDEDLELIITPAGSFDCINIRGQILASDPNSATHEYVLNNYFAAGVGPVQTNNYFWSSGRYLEARLVSFTLP